MKILRVRRGFTTNSSSASEYLPPGPPPATGGSAGAGEDAFWTRSGGPLPATGAPDGGSAPPLPYGLSGGAAPSAQQTGQTGVSPSAVPAQPPASGFGNAAQLGGLAALVALVFAADRLVRRVLGKKRGARE